MNYPLLMGMLHCFTNGEKQFDSFTHGQTLAAAVLGNGISINPFHCNEGLATASRPCVEHARNVRMILNGGLIGPSNSPGAVNLLGSLTSQGLIEFEIQSLESFDKLQVSGDFNAGGIIAIRLLEFQPELGNTFDLIDFSTFTNAGYAFDFTQAELGSGMVWDTSAFSATGVIGVVAVPEPSGLTLLVCIGLAASICYPKAIRRFARCLC